MGKIYISKGMNLKNENSELNAFDNDRNDLYYNADLSSIIERDDAIKLAIGRATGMEVKMQYNPEYRNWYRNVENLDLSAMDYFRKRVEMSSGEYEKVIAKGIKELQDEYATMFNMINTKFNNALTNGKPEKLKVENDHVTLDNKIYLQHSIPMPKDKVEIENRRKLGILASEWFGVLEKFAECRFCSSFQKIENDSQLNSTEENVSPNISFLIDTQSLELRKLLRLDYFDFLRNRKTNNLDGYSKEELEFLSDLDEWSNCELATNEYLKRLNGSSAEIAPHKHPNWSAIPGGVPSKFVVGIKVSGIDIDKIPQEITNELKKFDCVIFDGTRKVIYEPNKIKEDKLEE